MAKTVEEAAQEGRAAVGKSWKDCPYSFSEKDLREAWCKARLKAEEQEKPPLQRLFLGSGPLSSVIGWIIFIALIVCAMWLYQSIFGCVDEFGRSYC